MPDIPVLRTARLVLRPWREEDLAPFAAMSADPRVMEFLPKVLSREESDLRAKNICEHFERHGFGLWAVEVVGVADFIGFVGLNVPHFQAHFTPCVDVGWRLAHEHWGHGYATEGGRASIEFAFGMLGLDEVVAMTVPANLRSQRVMERLGMTRTPADDFEHPGLAEGHPLRPHVLYRISRGKCAPSTEAAAL